MKKKSGRIWKIKPFIGKYNRKERNYPSGKNYWKKIEKNNLAIALYPDNEKSVFHWQILTNYIFSGSLMLGACYITGQWNDFRVTNGNSCYIHLFGIYCCFFIKKCGFIIFLFHEESNFCYRISTNQKPKLEETNCQWNSMKKLILPRFQNTTQSMKNKLFY